MTGYDNGLTMTAVVEDGVEGASVWALCELQYGRTHFVTHRYIHDDVMSTRFKLNRPIKYCGRWFPSTVITGKSVLYTQLKTLNTVMLFAFPKWGFARELYELMKI